MNDIRRFVRLESNDIPVYICPEVPDWFVPTPDTDRALRELRRCEKPRMGGYPHALTDSVAALLERIAAPPHPPYTGRQDHHGLDSLSECWFHLTDRCNMRCTHCMFGSSDDTRGASLSPGLLRDALDQAAALGCRIFYFTGGEPFVYPDFTDICDRILARPDTHVVVLTNAALVSMHREWLASAPHGRLHFQVSIDGDHRAHDAVRGTGAYDCLRADLALLVELGLPVNLAMSVTAGNVDTMADIVRTAAELGVRGVHYLWLFARGRASEEQFVDCDRLYQGLADARRVAAACGVVIDNVEVLRSQLFTAPGTRFDLSNSGWESIAVGPDGAVYPSPATIGLDELRAGHVEQGLETVWRESPVLDRVRAVSLIDSPVSAAHPLRFLIGGGDIDHSYTASGRLVGGDPYVALYTRVALDLIAEHARQHVTRVAHGLRCRMGELLVECGPQSKPVMFTHSNCVQSLSDHDSHSLVRSFYARAADHVNEDIRNPIAYEERHVAHIPHHMRVRSYGCGSPVLDCDLRAGQTLVDLGCGAGMECFIAARLVGPAGAVYGIDMEQAMLRRANASLDEIAATLGYRNVSFRRGFLESLPLESGCADVLISNCVINLTADKRAAFEEALRVLRPGGRLCISDIVTDEPLPLDIKYNERLRGECLGGAMLQSELFAMLEEIGFRELYLVRRYAYRTVGEHTFFSVTYRARAPVAQDERRVIYRGPFRSVVTDDGDSVRRGRSALLRRSSDALPPESFFVLDSDGNVTNVPQETACGVFVNPSSEAAADATSVRHGTDCLVCGAPLEYTTSGRTAACHYCGRTRAANASCTAGHFVCDRCHAADARVIIADTCHASVDADPVALFLRIRSHPSFAMHGPEYHMLVPAVLIAAYRNAGGKVAESAIDTAIERGSSVAGGACAFLGACGAALGVGTAFSVLLEATPYDATLRQSVQRVTARVLERIAGFRAGRCCQRDCLVALHEAAVVWEQLLPVSMVVETTHRCTQYRDNQGCIGAQCPWWPHAGDDQRRRAETVGMSAGRR
ncbi:MAG: methyltransferase domain-containing protein [Chitinivibrionales bacterium]|nr:methyltransferase domain-containing protein [Chitinivibrionales bacterium]